MLEYINCHDLSGPPLTTPLCACVCVHRYSYTSIKVYLAGIRLTHLELGLSDPTSDECLRLVVRGIRRFQGDSTHPRLPITINLLHTLKQQLRISNFSLVKQHLLWAAFTMAFYAFLHVSEFTSSTNNSRSVVLQWSDILWTPHTLTITLRQSDRPFSQGPHLIHLSHYHINMSRESISPIWKVGTS